MLNYVEKKVTWKKLFIKNYADFLFECKKILFIDGNAMRRTDSINLQVAKLQYVNSNKSITLHTWIHTF